MRTTTTDTGRRQEQRKASYRRLVGALGLVSMSLVACNDAALSLEGAARKSSGRGGPASGSGGAGGAGATDPSATGGPSTPDASGGASGSAGAGGASACLEFEFDHDVDCADIAAAKDQSGADCRSRGLVMTAFGPAQDCHAGDIRRLKYTCCPESEVPPPPPTEQPPRDPKSCTSHSMGGSTSCHSRATWTSYAVDDCSARGYDVVDLSFVATCDTDSYRVAGYACCTKDGSEIPVPPVPVNPFDTALVTGPSRYAKYKCCTSAASCEVVELGDDSTCKDTAMWNAEASAACTAVGGMLYGVPQFVSCSL